jgi:hypothetical protein
MVEDGRRAAKEQLRGRVQAAATQVDAHFRGHKTDTLKVEWNASTPLQRAVIRGVSLVLAAESPADFTTLIEGELGRKRESSLHNASRIFDAAIPEDPALVRKYKLSGEQHYTSADINAGVPVNRDEEVAVGKSRVRQLETLVALQEFDRIEVALLLTELHFLSEGQEDHPRQNLKGRKQAFRAFTKEAIRSLAPQEEAPITSHTIFEPSHPDASSGPKGVDSLLDEIDNVLPKSPPPVQTYSSRTVDSVLDHLEDVLGPTQ